ncbi:MAG TPA: alpha/beta hydrolase-fold protein [Candidatus Limiplasma sp.]|nr:alpha/beta hydrolase-fold protein [Candidatus Limiplasma sp.]HRX08029.1 alpha/beta hydrolase-fold protein [Candidatus Limiplasma sp.]
MAIMRYNYFSEVLSLCVDVTITYPSRKFTYSENSKPELVIREEAKPALYDGMKFQTVYMLHGGGDDDSLLLRYTNLERYAEDNCVMTVTAQAKDSFFIDTAYGFRYFTFMTEELPRVIQCLFASSPAREDNFVIGMAMGGNAALMLAMKRPDLYAGVVDLSGGIGCSIDTDYFVDELETWKQIRRLPAAFGTPESQPGGPWDLGAIAKKNFADKVTMPELYIAVGDDDFIRDVVRKDRDALSAIGYQFHYEEAPGLGHEWAFWDQYIQKALNEWLPLRRSVVPKPDTAK